MILNLSSDGFPNLLVVISGAIASGKHNEAELSDAIMPSGLVTDPSKTQTTLRRWTELGLFVHRGDEYHLGPHFDGKFKPDQISIVGSVRRAARRCALAPENNSNFWAQAQSGAADLSRALAWLLAQDVYGFNSARFEQLESEQVPGNSFHLFKNSTRVTGLRRWAHFLGFVRDTNADEIDPTLAIGETLDIFPTETPIVASEFVSRLAAELPVLDLGEYRVKVQSKLDETKITLPEQGVISSSLSRALLNLEAKQRLFFESKADAGDGIMLTGVSGPRADLRFTHITVFAELRA